MSGLHVGVLWDGYTQWDPDASQVQALPLIKLGLFLLPAPSGLPNIDLTFQAIRTPDCLSKIRGKLWCLL